MEKAVDVEKMGGCTNALPRGSAGCAASREPEGCSGSTVLLCLFEVQGPSAGRCKKSSRLRRLEVCRGSLLLMRHVR